MCGISSKVKGFSFSYTDDTVSEDQTDAAGQYVTEFFSLMRVVRVSRASFFQCNTDRLHHIFLCIRDDPFNPVTESFICFFKIIGFLKADLVIIRVIKKVLQVSAKTLQDIDQCGNGGRC